MINIDSLNSFSFNRIVTIGAKQYKVIVNLIDSGITSAIDNDNWLIRYNDSLYSMMENIKRSGHTAISYNVPAIDNHNIYNIEVKIELFVQTQTTTPTTPTTIQPNKKAKASEAKATEHRASGESTEAKATIALGAGV